MPEFAMGFWQCKLRYQTQEELLAVAREYKKRGLPISVIVCDFFHWPLQGDWKFDPRCWPDPDAMVKELRGLGIELMVSVWPTVDKKSANFEPMREAGLLTRVERGIRTTMDFMGSTVFFDATNPDARKFVWDQVKENYYAKGIRIFWLDEAEPEYSVYDFDNYRYHLGSDMEVGNFYPVGYAQAFYEGMQAEGQEQCHQPPSLRLGGEPALRRAGLVRRHRLHVLDASAAAGRGAQHGDRRDSLVDDGHRWLRGWRSR